MISNLTKILKVKPESKVGADIRKINPFEKQLISLSTIISIALSEFNPMCETTKYCIRIFLSFLELNYISIILERKIQIVKIKTSVTN